VQPVRGADREHHRKEWHAYRVPFTPGEVAEKVRPPRTLLVPFPIGYPLGVPDQPALQQSIIRAALGLFDATGPLPLLHAYK
jgi:hypothetical protein